MTLLVLVALLVIAILAIGLGRELASYSSKYRSETRLGEAPFVVAKATSVRRYFRRHL